MSSMQPRVVIWGCGKTKGLYHARGDCQTAVHVGKHPGYPGQPRLPRKSAEFHCRGEGAGNGLEHPEHLKELHRDQCGNHYLEEFPAHQGGLFQKPQDP